MSKAWTIICDGATAKLLTGGSGRPPIIPNLQARVIPNCACFTYPSVKITVKDRERFNQEAKKWTKVERSYWERAGADRDFMGRTDHRDTDIRDPSYWPRVFEQARERLFAFLRENPRP